MILAYLLLLTGLTISAVAIYYSVVGLAAIFSAAMIPIIIMGSALEVGKLVCASWLKANWERAPRLMKVYMTVAVIVLMLITSMGIFGFLSKAHSDQSLVSGDVIAKISIYDEKIKTEKENIEANRKALKQMDEAVDQSMARSTTEQGANRAVNIRQQQARERTRLQNEITASQKKIASLNEERAPIAAEVRKVEAEVGPLKYIAAFIYGATDETLLEKAVTWVIITIIVVFDPLAVIMLLAAQMTFGWRREEKQNEGLLHKTVPLFVPPLPEEKKPTYEPDDGALTQEQLDQINQMASEASVKTEPIVPEPTIKFVDNGEHPKDKFEHELEVKEEPKEEVTRIEPTISLDNINELDRWNKMIEEAERADLHEKEAMRKWKIEHPEDTIKNQEKKKELGLIEILPWELEQQRQAQIEAETAAKYKIFPTLQNELNKLEPDFPKQERIKPDLTEVVETEDQKKNELRDETSGSADNKDSSVTYVQNSEQSNNSLWNRINKENK
jgi:hypothetical protein